MATDYMVFNVTRDDIRVRMAVHDEDIWPLPSITEKLPADPNDKVGFSDYISDIVYSRYGIGSPVVDPETGNVYLQLSNGRCVAFTRDGEPLWEISLMEKLGRLTFPNGRTGGPAVWIQWTLSASPSGSWAAALRFTLLDGRATTLSGPASMVGSRFAAGAVERWSAGTTS